MSPRCFEGGEILKNKQTNSTSWARWATLCATLGPSVQLLDLQDQTLQELLRRTTKISHYKRNAPPVTGDRWGDSKAALRSVCVPSQDNSANNNSSRAAVKENPLMPPRWSRAASLGEEKKEELGGFFISFFYCLIVQPLWRAAHLLGTHRQWREEN